jgi:hypothetical protein
MAWFSGLAFLTRHCNTIVRTSTGRDMKSKKVIAEDVMAKVEGSMSSCSRPPSDLWLKSFTIEKRGDQGLSGQEW